VTGRGVWLGVDPGQARIGVAASDPERRLAVPVETVPRRRGDVARIAAIALEREASVVVVGLPRSLSGAEGPSAAAARDFARSLAAVCTAPVRLFDERLTTVTATRELRRSGRTSRQSRGVIDESAAAVLLQAALDMARDRDDEVGELVPAVGDSGEVSR
jgi:putative Holliday junction resolvase